ncbi:MAG: hypothetical protein IJD51_03965 [Clostridia bacterium]|nr:hypothetical protein [Clostridia bacterium]
MRPVSNKKGSGKLNISDVRVNLSNLTQLAVGILAVWMAIFSAFPIAVAGIQLFAMYLTAFGFFALGICFYKGLVRFDYVPLTFSVAVIVCALVSIMMDWSVFDSVYGILLYSLPFLLLFLPRYVDIPLHRVCFFIQLMTLIAGIVSFLIVVGLVESGVDGYNITILKVDNTIGLIGLIVSFYLLNIRQSNKIFAWVTVAVSLFVIVSGQSRARMVYGAVIVALWALYMIFFAEGGRMKNTVVLVCAAVVAIMFVVAYSTQLQEYLSFVIGKFGEIGEDESSAYRFEEMQLHLRLFGENVWFGIGSGALNNEYRTEIGETIYGHNMLTGVFAFEGIFYALIFIALFVSTLVRSLRRFIKKRSPETMLVATLTVIITVLSVTSGGFSKLGTHIGMLVVGIILNGRREPTEE